MDISILYHSGMTWIIVTLCLLYALKIYGESNSQLLTVKNNFPIALLLGILIIFYIGFRPIEGGDNRNYQALFDKITLTTPLDINFFKQNGGDWLFQYMMRLVSTFGDIHLFFLFIGIIYVSGHLIACRAIVPNNPYITFLLCISAFSFFAYGTNGIRNGAACAIILMAISLVFTDKKILYIAAALLCYIASVIHTSTLLPGAALFLSIFVIKDFRITLAIWIACIIVSLIGGQAIANIFTGLGLDDRLDSYIESGNQSSLMANFSKTGFRWDFLLYSAVPIVLGIYTIIVRKIQSRRYTLLLNIYTLCNSFWVIVIYAAFSNRFAYLSWFLYPIVLAYPCLRLKIFNKQGQVFALIIFGHTLLTLLI